MLDLMVSSLGCEDAAAYRSGMLTAALRVRACALPCALSSCLLPDLRKSSEYSLTQCLKQRRRSPEQRPSIFCGDRN